MNNLIFLTINRFINIEINRYLLIYMYTIKDTSVKIFTNLNKTFIF